MNNLALKYRPQTFEDVVAQKEITAILNHQLSPNTTKNSYLFVGPSGCGKTTTARILANELNKGIGQPYEIDAASNTGVDNIRKIIDQAAFKSINSDYKVFIIDECHMLSVGAWNALLKLLEEPPAHAVIILCTTDPQKIIPTVLSRVQRFDFTKIPTNQIIDRLVYILSEENINTFEMEAIETIADLSKGGMRTAISLLDKIIDYTTNITYDNTCLALGIINNASLQQLTTGLFKGEMGLVIDMIESLYTSGKDMKQVIRQWLEWSLSKTKKAIVNNDNHTQYIQLIDLLLNLSNGIKYDEDPKVLIEAELLIFMEALNAD